ncbi:MAG: RnfH family protein [Woeseiaceae bacterium]|nr:RnfH family protein [Woeseiaceae bacterium]
MNDRISVEIVAGLSDRQLLLDVEIDAGATVAAAVDASRILKRFPEMQGDEIKFGVWGRVVPPEHRLKAGDRVEIYRPLQMDPREARRQLALVGKTMRG